MPLPVAVPQASLFELTVMVYSLEQEVTANNPMSARLKANIFAFIILKFKVKILDSCDQIHIAKVAQMRALSSPPKAMSIKLGRGEFIINCISIY